MILRYLPILALCGGVLVAQTSTTPDLRVTPTVGQFTTCSSTGSTPIYAGNNPTVRYRLTFYTDGTNFTAASVGIQGAPAATGGPAGTAGTFTSSTNITLVEGSVSPLANPIASAAQGTIVVSMYYPWIRVLCNSVTGSGGTVYYTLWGYDGTSPALSQGGAASPTGNVNVVQYGSNNVPSAGLNGLFGVGGPAADGAARTGNPVIIGGEDSAGTPLAHVIQTDTFGGLLPSGVTAPLADGISNTVTVPAMAQAGAPVASSNRSLLFAFNGTTWDRAKSSGGYVQTWTGDPCQNPALQPKTRFTVNQTGNAKLISGTTAKKTYICSFNLVTATTQNIALLEGTQVTTVCDTAPLGMAGGATAATGWNMAANGGMTHGAGNGTVFNSSVNADDVCLFQSGAGQVSGGGEYVQQ